MAWGRPEAGEDRQLLAADQGVQSVDSGNAGLDKFLRIVAGCRVHRQAVDVHALFGQDFRTAVNGAAQSVEHAAEHILGNAQLHGTAQKADLTVGQVDTGGIFKQLNQGVAAVDFQHLAAACFAVKQVQFRPVRHR